MLSPEALYLAVGTVIGALLGFLSQSLLQRQRAAHEKSMRRADEVRRVYMDYLLLAQRIPLIIDRAAIEGSGSSAMQEVEEQMAVIQAALRLYAPAKIRDFVRTRVPEALGAWHERAEELSAEDLALPMDSRVGYKHTQQQAFREKLSPALDELAAMMRKDVT